ncbi:MAG TPA: Fic family protein, partial [Pseudonocardiaceae bacterium]|nr:Fic family protein [Pseudonocardiaceae bacterium]
MTSSTPAVTTCTVPEDSHRCPCEALPRLRRLHDEIIAAAAVLDRNTAAPVRWTGRSRRELLGYGLDDEADRYRDTFNWCITLSDALTEDRIREIHHRAVGGRQYRTCHLWITNGFRHAEPDEIAKLMRIAFSNYLVRCRDWPSSARALGLHLDILTAHPFRDGNGRTARLAAAIVLVQAGFRSTTFTAVDRYFECEPATYLHILDAYRYAQICRTRTIELLVQGMAEAVERECTSHAQA